MGLHLSHKPVLLNCSFAFELLRVNCDVIRTATPPYITATQEQVGTTQEQVYRGEGTRQRLTINPIIQYITKWDSIRLAPTINYAKCTTLPNREYLVLLGKMTTIIFYSRIISLLKVCK